jgi:2-C-methyl-D-erythritol 2,4-cyclodiphosphate synthase
VPVHQISLKAKTTEGMGFCGREEGMEAYAVVSLVQK